MRFGWPRSLIARILLLEGVAILCAAILIPLLTGSVLQRTKAIYQEKLLVAQAQSIAAELTQARSDAGHLLLPPALEALYASTYDGRAFAIVAATGRAVAFSRHAGGVPWQAVPRSRTARSLWRAGYVIVSVPVRLSGATLWILVSQDETRPGAITDDITRAFLTRYLALLLPILLLLPVVNSVLIARLVRSVRQVSDRAAAIGPRSLHVRLADTGLPTEVRPLVDATNGLVERLEQSFAAQAEFVGNVVHELRTPLATLRVRLDAVADDTLRAALLAQADRMSHVVSQLRDLARLDSISDEDLVAVDLVALARDTLAQAAPMALASGHPVAFVAPDAPVRVRGNRVLLDIALTNLLSNAVRHTAAGTAIEVAVCANGALVVTDRGPGITVSDRSLLTQRFWRADHLRSDSAGIGLSLVQRIVDLHDGRIEIGDGADGGARFALLLPLMPASV
ncbi:HAMP domain-containing sensor histidine kinase [Sphingomonas sp. CARO-RG-8B-R24-01]|uniref:sensor histidine kinase n=1 Tax=Sphingomonas sp. CARO-RG-8B-R24-01 TaxID=2914831 RepID=UPI001F580B6F|nr:HAMP domain-containing sensor histidine kinase [Sphingomonas sp. CARO-RG-8B-R24-01]